MTREADLLAIGEVLASARDVQEFLWAGHSDAHRHDMDVWMQILEKRMDKLRAIETSHPHWEVEFRKRVLQLGAVSVRILAHDPNGGPERSRPRFDAAWDVVAAAEGAKLRLGGVTIHPAEHPNKRGGTVATPHLPEPVQRALASLYVAVADKTWRHGEGCDGCNDPICEAMSDRRINDFEVDSELRAFATASDPCPTLDDLSSERDAMQQPHQDTVQAGSTDRRPNDGGESA